MRSAHPLFFPREQIIHRYYTDINNQQLAPCIKTEIKIICYHSPYLLWFSRESSAPPEKLVSLETNTHSLISDANRFLSYGSQFNLMTIVGICRPHRFPLDQPMDRCLRFFPCLVDPGAFQHSLCLVAEKAGTVVAGFFFFLQFI